jgi:hypothetical protein
MNHESPLRRCLILLCILQSLGACAACAARAAGATPATAPAAAPSASAPAAPAADFYVAPDGDDANPGTADRPFKTMIRARDAVRVLKIGQQSGAVKDIIVMLRGGRYYVARPICFDVNDSSNYGRTITYRNYPGETPVLIGGVRIDGWKRFKDNIFAARVPFLGTGLFDLQQIFENGTPDWPARTPNEGWLTLENPRRQSFCYRAADLGPMNHFDASHLDAGQLAVRMYEVGSYFSNRIPVQRIDPSARRIWLRARPYYMPVAGQDYLLEGAMEFLDAPGEFCADPKTQTLYLWPHAPIDESSEIVVPTAPSIIQFKTYSAEAPVHDVAIEGLELIGGAAPALMSGPWADQGDNGHPGVEFDRATPLESTRWGQVQFKNAQKISIRNCRLLYGGMNALALNGASRAITVSGCDITGCVAHGLLLGGDPVLPDAAGAPSAQRENGHHTITNNYIHHTGRGAVFGSGVAIGGSGHNTISHNLFTDIPRSAVTLFFQWDIPRARTSMTDNVISHNEMIRTGTATWDGGAFYIGSTADHTRFENNRIADIWSWFVTTYNPPGARPDDNCSIDFDPGSAGVFDTLLQNNLCYGADAWVVESGSPEEYKPFNNYFDSDYAHFHQIMVNGQWTASPPFDASKVQADIGLTRDFPFPYPGETARPLALPIAAGFEGTLSPCYLYKWSDGPEANYLTAARAHGGRGSLCVDKDQMVARYRHPAPQRAAVSVWMYDDPAKTAADCFATLRDASNARLALGVDGKTAPDRYVLRIRSARSATKIQRSAGWHELAFTPSASGWDAAIDGQTVGHDDAGFGFCYVDLGDDTTGTDSRGMCFDDLMIK